MALDPPRTKPVFTKPEEAMAALVMDKLGTVYYKSNGVFVVTSHGSGTFTHADWRAARGYENSQVKT